MIREQLKRVHLSRRHLGNDWRRNSSNNALQGCCSLSLLILSFQSALCLTSVYNPHLQSRSAPRYFFLFTRCSAHGRVEKNKIIVSRTRPFMCVCVWLCVFSPPAKPDTACTMHGGTLYYTLHWSLEKFRYDRWIERIRKNKNKKKITCRPPLPEKFQHIAMRNEYPPSQKNCF